MSKKELFLKILFGLVNAYLITLLVFVTCKHVFSMDASQLSALGAIGSAVATLFAAFVAYWLYNDWRDPHKANFYLNECKKIISSYKVLLMLNNKLSELQDLIEKEYPEEKLKNIHLLNDKKLNKLDKINQEIDDTISKMFSILDDLYPEFTMLAYLTENHSFLFDYINMRDNLKASYDEVKTNSARHILYSVKYRSLVEANKNEYLIAQGMEIISRVKKLGKL